MRGDRRVRAGASVAGLVLAAGEARRMGAAKQCMLLGGETLLDRAVRVAREAELDPVVVVLGARAEQVRARCALRGAVVVVHEAWAEGMGSSLRAGMRYLLDHAPEIRGLVVMVCDMPSVTAEHLRRLSENGEPVVASAYNGRRGVPAFFGRDRMPELMVMRGDQGARGLLQGAATVELRGGEMDVDTPEQMERARQELAGLGPDGGR